MNLDDLLNTFNTMVSQINPTELQLNKEYSFNTDAPPPPTELQLNKANPLIMESPFCTWTCAWQLA